MLKIGEVYKTKRPVELVDSRSSGHQYFSQMCFIPTGTVATILEIEREHSTAAGTKQARVVFLIDNKKYDYYIDSGSIYPVYILFESDWERIC